MVNKNSNIPWKKWNKYISKFKGKNIKVLKYYN